MHIVEIKDMHFETWKNAHKGLELADQYVKQLSESHDGIELFQCLMSWQDFKRYFHISVYTDNEAYMQTSQSSDYKDFSKGISDLLRENGERISLSKEVMSGGGGDGTFMEVKLDEIGETCIVDDLSFLPDGDIPNGMQAFQELVDSYSNHVGNVFSIWSGDIENPLRFFQLNYFTNNRYSAECRTWDEVLVARDKLIKATDPDKIEMVWTDNKLSTGGKLEEQRLTL